MTGVESAATVAAAICSGLSGGVYFAFSAIVLPALRSRSEGEMADEATGEATATMRAINVAAVRAPFMVVFFGGAVSAAAVVAIGLFDEPRPLRIAGGVLALAAFGITVGRNVPLNEALARGTLAGHGSVWARFEPRWRRANHARTILSVLAAIAMTTSLAER
jgi:uncharacterized membrane protein